MRCVIFMLGMFFLVLNLTGCHTVERVYSDYQLGRTDEALYNDAQINSERVGDVAGVVSSIVGVSPVVSGMVDKISTVMSCFLFLWYGGYHRRRSTDIGK